MVNTINLARFQITQETNLWAWLWEIISIRLKEVEDPS